MSEGSGYEHSIRFITSNYDELFRIPDGGTILVTFPDQQFVEKCSYIDDYHTKIGNSVYHICQYAEILEQNNAQCEPEPETQLDKAAWQIGNRDFLLIEKGKSSFRYELVTKEFLSRSQGQLDRKDLTVNQAREHILDYYGIGRQSRVSVSFDFVKTRIQEVLKASDVTNIEWQNSRYYPGMRAIEHNLTCKIRGVPVQLRYEVSQHDDGEGFAIHSNGEDIWDRMPEPELRKLEELLHEAVEYGHWIDYLDQAKTVEAVREVRYSLYETEELTREQIQALHKAVDDKEALLSKAGRADLNKKSVLKELETKKSRTGNAKKQSTPATERQKNKRERG